MTTRSMPKRSLGKFYLVLSIFILPMIASWLLFYFHDHLRLKTLNHGNLISPAINMTLLLNKNNPTPTWQIIHITDTYCDAACEKMNYQLNQVRKTFGKDAKRLTVVSLSARSELTKQLQLRFQENKLDIVATRKILLVDPLGNIFMYYQDTTNPMDILKDLKRVLEVSQIG